MIAVSDMPRSQKHDHVLLQVTVEVFQSPFAGKFIRLDRDVVICELPALSPKNPIYHDKESGQEYRKLNF